MKKRILSDFYLRLLLSGLLFSSFSFSAFSEQGLKIKQGSGTVSSFSYTNARKLVFVNETMSVLSSAGSVSGTFTLNTVSNISFGEVASSSVRQNFQESSLSVYPNPAIDFITVRGVDSGLLSIYSVVGAKVYETQLLDSNEKINVSALSSGIYILSVNGKSFKFNKK